MKTLCIDCKHARPIDKSRLYKDILRYIELTIRAKHKKSKIISQKA